MRCTKGVTVVCRRTLASPAAYARFYTEGLARSASSNFASRALFAAQYPAPPPTSRNMSAASIDSMMVAEKIRVLEDGPSEVDMCSGHLLAWSRHGRDQAKKYLFDSAAAKAFRERHEVLMESILVSLLARLLLS
ncbi:hypothetical protein TeGR_g14401 [Tetraparma gracilis]|uniref:Uncharacterized protein n=1 Tax=Tetraparma gracilis TaxID=2962635 RepID=A0ABQ6MLQ9_9STRA|nr:hypothetical protein TeGR_g14401 [Tetraparma gracilis]